MYMMIHIYIYSTSSFLNIYIYRYKPDACSCQDKSNGRTQSLPARMTPTKAVIVQ